MRTTLPTSAPFSFDQSIAFIRRFLPCSSDYLVTDDALTAAVTIRGRAVPLTVQRRGERLEVETGDPKDLPDAVTRAAHWLGANDDVAAFYAAAAGDPPMRRLVAQLHGLHHVRFLTLEEISVYCVMMQRTPITMAARMKRAFLVTFGTPIEVGGTTLRAMPSLAALTELDGAAIGKAIRHAPKGASIARVVRGVAAIGEATLREAPYAEAREALLAVPGIGPFSAG